jgi:rhodanese-related sulfurtransferase
MKQITMHDLNDKLGQLAEGEVILDVRTEEEFEEGHIPGAINISHESVADRIDELKKYKKIYIHCRSGGRVRVAAAALQAAGLGDRMVCIFDGGMLDWAAAGYPLEK